VKLRSFGTARSFLTAGALLLSWGLAARDFGEEPPPLRVCADPENLPYSSQQLDGFENKIASIVASDLEVPLEYFWWPAQRGLVRNTLQAGNCDVLIEIPKGYDPVLWTKPYFRSTYVIVYRRDRGLSLRSLDDPAFKGLKIGVQVNTPPYDALANRGLAGNLIVYRMFFDPRDPNPDGKPQRPLEELAAGTIDVAVVWGPLAGYFARQHPSPALEIVPLEDDPKVTMSFEFSMGVSKGDRALKERLEGALERKGEQVRKVLEDYGVPLLPLKTPSASPPEKAAPPGSHKHDPGDD
jgi:mxaJ protein